MMNVISTEPEVTREFGMHGYWVHRDRYASASLQHSAEHNLW
jgi:hypothetical protein